MQDTDIHKRNEIQSLVFKLVDNETDPGRQAYLLDCLHHTWFGSLESIEEFMEADDNWRFTAEYIAQEYVDNA